jgi:formyl-CoA transferase
MIGNPIRFSRTPIEYGRAPPRLGAHTSEVLRQGIPALDPELDGSAEQGIVTKQSA